MTNLTDYDILVSVQSELDKLKKDYNDLLLANLRLIKLLKEIKDAYIDLTSQDEYSSYYIDEAKDFVNIVERSLKEASFLQELEK